MDQDTFAAQLLATFVEEIEEHVRVLNHDVVALEKAADSAARAERLTTLLRAAHSLKGAARAVNVRPIERACHHVEDILLAVRNGQRALEPELCSLVLATADAIEDAGVRLRARQDLGGAPIGSLLPRLEAAATAASLRGVSMPVATSDPEPPEPGRGAPERPRPVSDAPTLADGVVRVAADRLDTLLAHTGELLVARRRVESRRDDMKAVVTLASRVQKEWRRTEKQLLGPARASVLSRRLASGVRRTGERLRQLEGDLARLATATDADRRLLDQAADPLDDDVRRIRMFPFAEACGVLDRTVRDLARASGKDAVVVIEGGDVELDRSVLEGLKDPLRHLVRNAVAHGIEPPDERRAAGKLAAGRIAVTATLRGAHVEIVVADDGRGLDLQAIRAQAVQHGFAEPGDDADAARLVFEPGLSTARSVTDVAGRGVGLDVVKSRIESFHGTVDVRSTPGKGTAFTLTAPLTLTTLHVLLVAAGGHAFAIGSSNVAELVRFDADALCVVQGREMLRHGGALIAVSGLVDTLGLPGVSPADGRTRAVIVDVSGQRVAFVVDELLAAQEIVVKSLGPRLAAVPTVSGATLLPSGRIALVLNPVHLVRTALGRSAGVRRATAALPVDAPRKRVLLADDSITTRALERSLLESAGYEVLVAVDGEAAWRLLQEHGADVVVSDVDMPRLDGCGLTEAIRASATFRDLPVVLLTGCESAEDRARGMRAGANAYLVKSAFEQQSFLATVAQLV